jgi:hypothetical protein
MSGSRADPGIESGALQLALPHSLVRAMDEKMDRDGPSMPPSLAGHTKIYDSNCIDSRAKPPETWPAAVKYWAYSRLVLKRRQQALGSPSVSEGASDGGTFG